MAIKLNIGASPIWKNDSWYILDHKVKENKGKSISGEAININLDDESCDVVFCSHVFEHIPHTQLPIIISEINRVLKPNGIFRLLTPDLEKVAKAYVNNDKRFFELAKEEDESLRTDLGYGGMFMNFIVSPGQDTVLIDRGLNRFISGYAHLYSYDFNMLNIMLEKLGFENRKADFCDSKIEEMRVPMHVSHLEKKWNNLNQEFYRKNKLVHEYKDGKYNINFTISGFDRDPLTSLIIESRKKTYIDKNQANKMFNNSMENFNRYSRSLLNDRSFVNKLDEVNISYKENNE